MAASRCMFLTVPMTGDQFLERCHARHWTHLGRGEYGTAMGKGHIVWKVQPSISTGWGAYITMVAMGRFRGPHVPRVRALVRLACGGMAALTERLRSSEEAWDWTTRTVYSEGLFSASRGGRAMWGLEHAQTMAAKWPDLPHLMMALGREFVRLDLHVGNFMARQDGTLVVTDPCT